MRLEHTLEVALMNSGAIASPAPFPLSPLQSCQEKGSATPHPPSEVGCEKVIFGLFPSPSSRLAALPPSHLPAFPPSRLVTV